MAVELATAYVSIVPETSKIAPEVKKALGAAEKGSEAQGKSMGSKISSGMATTLKKSAVGVGVATGGVLATGLTKGIGRLSAIEMAESKLTGLGNSASDVSTIMQNANAAVKGTAYGLDEAATTAAMAVASGIKPGAELEQVLKTTADTAGIAGTSMSEMGAIFGSVAARGKLQGDDMLQLTSRGIPVLQLLGKELGKTTEEVSEMVSRGEIDFKTFERAMRSGVGGAALEAGNTVQGSFKNMGAALGRLGATMAGPFYSQAAGAFKGVTSALDALDDQMKPVMADLSRWLEGTAVPALQKFGKTAKTAFEQFRSSSHVQAAIAGTASAFEQLASAAVKLGPPIGQIVAALGQATAALGISTWQVFVSTLQAAGAVAEALAGPLGVVADFLQDHPGMVTAAVAAWAGFKTVPALVNRVTAMLHPMTGAVNKAKSAMAGIKDTQAYFAATGREVGRLGATMNYFAAGSTKAAKTWGAAARGANNQVTQSLAQTAAAHKQAGSVITSSMATAGAAVSRFAGGALGGLKSAAMGVMGVFGGPWGVALAGATAVMTSQMSAAASTKSAHEDLARSVKEGEQAQRDLQEALAGTTGALSDEGLAAAANVAKSALAEFTAEGNRTRSISEWINQATVGVDEFMAKIPGMTTEAGRANAEMTRQAKDTREAYKQLEKTASEMGLSIEDVNRVVAQGGPEFDQLVSKLRESGEAGNRAADELVKVREEVQKQIDAARRLSPAFVEASNAVDTLADSSSSADDKLSALETVMKGMGLIPQTTAEAVADAADAISEMAQRASEAADATGGLGDELIAADGTLDPWKDNSRELAGELTSMRQELQNVALAGGDTGEVFERMQPVLDSLAEKYGLTGEKVDELRKKYGVMPDLITTLVELEGAEGVKGEIAAVAGSLVELEEGKEVPVKLEDEETKAKLEELGFNLRGLPNGETGITMDDAAAGEKLLWWVNAGLPQIDMANPTAKANLDDSGLMYKTEYAKYQLATLDLQQPTPLANMDISRLNAAQQTALQEVGLLDGQTPTPDAYMDISSLTAEQQNALAQVFDLDAQTPTPVADMNKSPLDGKVASAHGDLDEVDNHNVQPKIDGENSGLKSAVDNAKEWIRSVPNKVMTFFEGIFRSSGGPAGHAAGGIVGYASGGRLPVAGPGTHEVDGILGVDGQGMPTARVDAGEWVINRRQSRKYHGLLDAINRDDPGIEDVARVAGYAQGGVVSPQELDRFAQGIEGQPYVWGGVHWGDCSGAQSALANYAVGRDPWGSRFATGNEQEELLARGFRLGRGGPGDLRIGWFNGGPWGGHTAGTLPNGVNVEMGGGRGNGQYGGPAAGSDDPQFTDHAYLPFVPDSIEATETHVEYRDGRTASSLDDWDEPLAEGSTTPVGAEGDPNMVPVDSTMRSDAAAVYDAAGEPGRGAGVPNPWVSESNWSSLAGALFGGGTSESVIGRFVSGQVSDVLNTLGIPDELPPVFKAGQQFMVGLQDATGKMIDAARAKNTVQDAAEVIDHAEGGGQDDALADAVRDAAAEKGWDTEEDLAAIDELVAQDPTRPATHWGEAFAGAMRRVDDAQAVAQAWVDEVERRYGNPVAAAQDGAVFDSGGVANGIGSMLKKTIKPERILSPEQTKAFNDFVYEQLPQAAEAFDGGGEGMAVGDLLNSLGEVAGNADPGAITDLLTNQLPAFLTQNTAAEIAGQVARGGVRLYGSAATNAAIGGVNAWGNAIQAGLATVPGAVAGLSSAAPGLGAAAANLVPAAIGGQAGVGVATELLSQGVSLAGPVVTELAAQYAGSVTEGVVGAFEQFGKEVFGAPVLGTMQDVLGVVLPKVGQAGSALADAPQMISDSLQSLPLPASGTASGPGNGDVINFNTFDFDAAASMFRREQAKRQKGLVGAR